MTAGLNDRMTENMRNFKTLYELKKFLKVQRCEENIVLKDAGRFGVVGKFWLHVWTNNVMKQLHFLISHVIGQFVFLDSSFMTEHNFGRELPVEPRMVEEYWEDSYAISNVEHFPRPDKVGVLTTSLLRGSVGLSEIMAPHVKQSRSAQSKGITLEFQVLKVG